MPFYVHRLIHVIKVKKERERTLFYGEGLVELIATYPGATFFHFSMSGRGPQPQITVVYTDSYSVGDGNIDEEDDESAGNTDEEDGESEEDDDMIEEDEPAQSEFVVECKNLNQREKEHLLQILPPRHSYIGFPFVHRMTNINVLDKHVMVCYKNIFHLPVDISL